MFTFHEYIPVSDSQATYVRGKNVVKFSGDLVSSPIFCDCDDVEFPTPAAAAVKRIATWSPWKIQIVGVKTKKKKFVSKVLWV